MLIRAARAKYPQASFEVPAQFARPVDELLEQRPPHLLGPPYPNWRDFELAVLDEVIGKLAAECPAGLSTCRWGDYNRVTIRHPLSPALPAFRRLLDMPATPTSGDNDMPRVHLPGFGASERFAVAPGREADSYLHLPGGQSGNPLSPFYYEGHNAWVKGRRSAFLPEATRHRQELMVE
jgi:penicillin amidase